MAGLYIGISTDDNLRKHSKKAIHTAWHVINAATDSAYVRGAQGGSSHPPFFHSFLSQHTDCPYCTPQASPQYTQVAT